MDVTFEGKSSTGKNEWLTPPCLLRRLGPFDLDPCSPVNRPWDTARHHYTIEDDGLQQPWFGRVFCNPPYDTALIVRFIRRMRYGSEPLDWTRFNDEHSRCFRFLEQSVKQSTARHLIVATHHVPSFELMAPEFKGSPLNGAFTVELGGFIADSPIEYWIYGHSHRNINKVIGNTRCICNQLGYVFSNEHTSFDKEAHISI
jgi:hypothetical protein